MELKEENLRYSTDRELFKAIFDVDNVHVEEVFKRSEVELIDRYHLKPDIALKLKVLCELAVRLQKRGAEEKNDAVSLLQ